MYFCRVPYGGWWPPGGSSTSRGTAASASDTEDAASVDEVYAFSKRGTAASETVTTTTSQPQPQSWPQYSRKRACTSPTLPDEELTSMLQNYLDEKNLRHSNKMELDYMHNQPDYYYNNQTFLPNVSPSASSLDSGYCGPASVQSSIESPHSHLGKEFYLLLHSV